MPEATTVHNPFLLMLHPEVVLAAIEKSERLAQLTRRQCRPLDRMMTPASTSATDADDDTVDDGDDAGRGAAAP